MKKIIGNIVFASILFAYIPWVNIAFNDELDWVGGLAMGIPLPLMFIMSQIKEIESLGCLIIAGYFFMHSYSLLLYTHLISFSIIYMFSLAIFLVIIRVCDWEEKFFKRDI